MTPEQAVELVDQAASKAVLSRADHFMVQQAVQTLRALISADRKKPDDDTPSQD